MLHRNYISVSWCCSLAPISFKLWFDAGCWLTSMILRRCMVCQLTPSHCHVISMSKVRLGLWIVAAIKNVSYYVKYFDMDSFSRHIFRECHLIPNLGGNRLTNDGKMAMNEGESDAWLRLRGKKGDFLLMRVSFNTQNNNDDESKHSS